MEREQDKKEQENHRSYLFSRGRKKVNADWLRIEWVFLDLGGEELKVLEGILWFLDENLHESLGEMVIEILSI